MRYLLDTHAFLWTLFEETQLSKNIADIIRNPENDILVSVITYWEISLKYSIGKLELHGILPEELPLKAKEIDIETLGITEHEAATYYSLPKLKHKDPFDRFIIWQAINAKITLITKDKEITKYAKHGLNMLW